MEKQNKQNVLKRGLCFILALGLSFGAFANSELINGIDSIMPILPQKSIVDNDTTSACPLIVVDDEIMTYDIVRSIKSDDIANICVLKDKSDIEKYSEHGANCVIEVTTHKALEAKYDNKNGDSNSQEKKTVVVDKMPSYPGGAKQLMKFLSETVKYPKIAVQMGMEARVLVKFVVEKDGSIVDVKVQYTSLLGIDRRKTKVAVKFSELNLVESVVVAELLKCELKKSKEALEREAKRVVCLMDNWIPGIENGEPIRVIYRIPITFKLK